MKAVALITGASSGLGVEFALLAPIFIMIVFSDSRTSAAEANRAAGCFSRHRRITDSNSTNCPFQFYQIVSQ